MCMTCKVLVIFCKFLFRNSTSVCSGRGECACGKCICGGDKVCYYCVVCRQSWRCQRSYCMMSSTVYNLAFSGLNSSYARYCSGHPLFLEAVYEN